MLDLFGLDLHMRHALGAFEAPFNDSAQQAITTRYEAKHPGAARRNMTQHKMTLHDGESTIQT